MSYFKSYAQQITKLNEKIFASEELITKVANEILNCFKKGGKIYTFGSGHGHLLSLEIFYRAGGLVRVVPVLDEALMLHISASQSTAEERKEGAARKLLQSYKFGENDILFVFSNSGRNAVTIEMAMCAKEKKGRVIALTNLNHSKNVESRHYSNKKLYEIADIVLDNFGEFGDACVTRQNGSKICPTSTATGAVILHLIVAKVVEIADENKVDVELFVSSNVNGGDEVNNNLIEKYKGEINHL